jgi:PKD repeat protein
MKKPQRFVLAAFVLFLTTGAILKINQAPVRRTNAPGEQSCGGCHPGNVNTGPGSVSLDVPTNGYVPGQTYSLNHLITDSTFNNVRFGFTTTVLDANNQQAGELSVLDVATSSLQTSLVSGSLREYIGHLQASSVSSWAYEWTAPTSNVGDITFYTVSVVANGNNGTSGDQVYEEAVTMSLSASYPQPDFTLGSDSLCVDSALSFTNASSGTIVSYAWDFGDGASPATSALPSPPAVSYASPGTKTVSLTTTGPDGSESVSKTIQVRTATVVMLGTDQSLCEGDSLQLAAQLSGPESEYALTWSGNGAFSDPQASEPFFLPAGSGPVVLTVNSVFGCGTSADSFQLELLPAPLPQISGTDTLLSSAAENYQWVFLDSLSGTLSEIVGATASSLALTDSLLSLPENQGQIGVAVSYENGCVRLSEFVPVAVLTSRAATFFQAISLHPNPTQGEMVLNYQLEQAGNLRLQLFDPTGKLHQQRDIRTRSTGSIPLDFSALSPGIYFLQLSAHGQQISRKILVQ